MNNFKILIILPFIYLMLSANSFAASYERKSVSYLDAVLLTDSNIKIQQEELDFLLNEVESKLSLERFDYNPLPDTLIREFLRRAHAAEPLTMEEIDALLKETIVPQVERILQENLEQRAAGLVGNEVKSSWVAEKAKSLGITSVELEKILNSSYIYFPVLSSVKRNEQGKFFRVELIGEVMWYRLVLTGEKPELRLMTSLDKAKMDVSTGIGRSDGDQSFRGRSMSGKHYAFFAAAEVFARNMEVAARELPDFRLAGSVREVGRHSLAFDIGSKEGIHLDDKFFIKQRVEDGTSFGEETVGLVQVTKVGFSGFSERYLTGLKNRGETPPKRELEATEARIVTGSGYDEGMSVIEYPRLGLDVGVGLHSYTITFGKTDTSERHLINKVDQETSNGIGLKLSAHYNTASWSNVSQLYLMLEAGLGVVGVDAYDYFTNEVAAAQYQTIAGGAVKKFSFRRVSIPVKMLIGYQAVDLEGWWSVFENRDGEQLIKVRNSAIGLIVGSGVEVLLTPAASLQLGVEYRLFSRSKTWDVIVNDDFRLPGIGPWVETSGINIGMTFVYSPPRLTFDPANIVKTMMGI